MTMGEGKNFWAHQKPATLNDLTNLYCMPFYGCGLSFVALSLQPIAHQEVD